MDKDAVIAQITAAFDGVSRAGGVSLREGRVIDDYGTRAERADARLLDKDMQWQDVSDADIEYYTDSLTFMDAIGFRYHLPAFMTYALRHFMRDEYDSTSDPQDVLGKCLFLLEVTQYDGKPSLERYKLITYTQAQAVGSFLQYVVEHGEEFGREDAARIFRDYWNYYP